MSWIAQQRMPAKRVPIAHRWRVAVAFHEARQVNVCSAQAAPSNAATAGIKKSFMLHKTTFGKKLARFHPLYLTASLRFPLKGSHIVIRGTLPSLLRIRPGGSPAGRTIGIDSKKAGAKLLPPPIKFYLDDLISFVVHLFRYEPAFFWFPLPFVRRTNLPHIGRVYVEVNNGILLRAKKNHPSVVLVGFAGGWHRALQQCCVFLLDENFEIVVNLSWFQLAHSKIIHLLIRKY